MPLEAITALLLPFAGTALGAAWVFFLNKPMRRELNRGLTGFAAGVMVAASIWSLIIPAMEQSAHYGFWAFFPALSGVWAGIGFLLFLDHWIPHLHQFSAAPEGCPSGLGASAMTVLAVTLHNLPEGMAVGVVIAGWLEGSGTVTAAMLALSLGIALQNLPEGAIVSIPLASAGMKKRRACAWGILSGVVEPLGAALTLLLAELVVPLLPYLLSFSAGAMLFVVVEELIPEMSEGAHSDTGTLCFGLGFTLMMTLDVVLG